MKNAIQTRRRMLALKRYGKTLAVDQPVPLAERPRAFTWARIVALVVTSS